MSQSLWSPPQFGLGINAREKGLQLASCGTQIPGLNLRTIPLTLPRPVDRHAPPLRAQSNDLTPLGQLLLGLAIGGLACLILDDLLGPTRRPHLEAWKREFIFSRDGGHCTHCGVRVTWSNHHIDHKIALACGGSNEVRNLTLSCKPCNLSKGTLSAREFRRHLYCVDPQMHTKFSHRR